MYPLRGNCHGKPWGDGGGGSQNQLELIQAKLGISREVGQEEELPGAAPDAGFYFLKAPLDSSGSCLDLAFLRILAAGRQSQTWALLCSCCWSAGLLQGYIHQILWLPVSTLVGTGDSQRIVRKD